MMLFLKFVKIKTGCQDQNRLWFYLIQLKNVFKERILRFFKGQSAFQKAVQEAEKLFKDSTEFSFDWTDLSCFEKKFQKIGNNLTKTLPFCDRSQPWGLIIQLVSKAIKFGDNFSDSEIDTTEDILYSQKSLAQIIETIKMVYSIHRDMVNLQDPKLENEIDLLKNKICILYGDFLVADAAARAAKLRNHVVCRLLGSLNRDLCESSYIGDRDEQNNPLPSDPQSWVQEQENEEEEEFDHHKPYKFEGVMGDPEKEWTLRTTLSTASLLAKGCEAALILAKHPKTLQQQFYKFGQHLCFAWQASLDLESFTTNWIFVSKFSLVSAPVLFHLKHDPSLYEDIKKGLVSVDNVDYKKIRNRILNGPGINKTRELLQKHCSVALEILNEELEISAALKSLENIVLALKN